MGPEYRYNYFVGKVAETEEIWGLWNKDGWATLGDNENRIVVPFWPEKEFALLCCTGEWSAYEPKSISLYDLMEKWLPGMQKDERLASVFLVPENKTGSIIAPAILLEDLNDEARKYH